MEFDKKVLFLLARHSIESNFSSLKSKVPAIPKPLQRNGASFVTLTEQGMLRGCIGSIISHQPLYKDVEQNAYNAAFHDYRFSPLSETEYENITIEISILTPLENVDFSTVEELRTIIRPGIDGILYHSHGRRATFLPQVWEKLPDFDDFFSHLSMKAGLGPQAEFDDCSIQRYQVQIYHE